VRHAAAGTRTKAKSDSKRKLSKKGLRQADKLGRRLAREPIVAIRTSGYTRCVLTMQPLGRSLAIAVDKDERLAEGESPKGLLKLIRESTGTTLALCSHNDTIGRLMKHLAAEGIDLGGVDEWRKASVWTFETQKGRIRSGSYHEPPS
jgi:8-oxo-dGTP diphosphatase